MSAGLLGRLRRRALGAPALGREASILAHLAQLLNARQGGSALDSRYGLPDLTDLAHRIPEGLPMLQRLLSETIQRHEPRLRKVSVSHVPSRVALLLQFEVRAELIAGGSLRFRTDVSPGGRVSIT